MANKYAGGIFDSLMNILQGLYVGFYYFSDCLHACTALLGIIMLFFSYVNIITLILDGFVHFKRY